MIESCQHGAFAWPPLPLLRLWREARRDLSHTLDHNVKKPLSAVREYPKEGHENDGGPGGEAI